VNKHLLCLTVDTDPDGLSGKVTDRQTLEWQGLEALQTLPAEMQALPKLGPLPITWFIRADGQLENILGSPSYLLEKYDRFWASVKGAGHELAWHPHLYRQARPEDAALIIADPNESQEELERLWDKLSSVLPATSFRHGEGWHTPRTYATVESLGFRCDSTAIPNRKGADGHPMNWTGAPNQPYFPDFADLCAAGTERALVELPMNTWLLQAPYDAAPKLRYINPAVHLHLFASALRAWKNGGKFSPTELYIWVMIFHPDEVLPGEQEDDLYARSRTALFTNLISFQESLRIADIEVEWVTIAQAAELWRLSHLRQIA
jgi:hypothetical protein